MLISVYIFERTLDARLTLAFGCLVLAEMKTEPISEVAV